MRSLWGFRGTYGWQFTVLYAEVIAVLLLGVSPIVSLIWFLWIVLGEGSGWKPKLWRNGDKLGCILRGFRLGGFGAILVPLATEISDRLHSKISWWKYEYNEDLFGWLGIILAASVAIGFNIYG